MCPWAVRDWLSRPMVEHGAILDGAQLGWGGLISFGSKLATTPEGWRSTYWGEARVYRVPAPWPYTPCTGTL